MPNGLSTSILGLGLLLVCKEGGGLVHLEDPGPQERARLEDQDKHGLWHKGGLPAGPHCPGAGCLVRLELQAHEPEGLIDSGKPRGPESPDKRREALPRSPRHPTRAPAALVSLAGAQWQLRRCEGTRLCLGLPVTQAVSWTQARDSGFSPVWGSQAEAVTRPAPASPLGCLSTSGCTVPRVPHVLHPLIAPGAQAHFV